MNKPTIHHLFFAFLTFLISGFGAKAQQVTQFQKVIGGSAEDLSYDVQNTLDGGFILTGATKSYGAGGYDIFLAKTDGSGTLVWRKTYGGRGDEIGWKVITTPDSGYIVAGSSDSYGRGKSDALVFKTDKDGTVQWTRSIGGDSTEEAYSLVRSRSGSIYVTGYAVTDTFGGDLFIAKLSASGSLNWFKTFGDKGLEEGFDIIEDSRGDLVAVGFTEWDSVTNGGINGNPGDRDVFVVKVDTSGIVKWQKNYGGENKDEAWGLSQYRGEYYLTGFTESFGAISRDVFLMHIDQAGNLKNTYSIMDSEDERAFDIKLISGTDRFAISAYQQLTGRTERNILHIQVSSTGFVSQYEIIGGSGRDGHWPTAAVQTPDHGFGIFSTARSFTSGNDDQWYLIKTNGNGVSNCNHRSMLQFASPATAFDSAINTYRNRTGNGTVTLTVNNFTPSLDSTLCCRLAAIVVGDSVNICVGESLNLGGPGVSGVTYTWTEVNGSFTSSLANPNVRPVKSTTYKLVVRSSNGSCASDSAQVKVVVRGSIPSNDLINDTNFCENSSYVLRTYTGQSYYEWKSRTISSFSSSVTLSQTDTVSLYLIDNSGCQYRDTAIITRTPLPRFSLGADTTICENVTATLNGPVTNIRSYNWNNGSANTQSFTTGAEQSHVLVVTDSNGCAFSDTLAIFNNPVSTFSLGADTGFCVGSTFTIIGPGFLGQYIWNDTASTRTNLTVNSPGTYWVSAANSFNCRFADTITLVEYALPVVNLGPDTGYCPGGDVLIRFSRAGSYRWNNNPSLNGDSLLVSQFGTYWLSYTDGNGCANTDTIVVAAYPAPDVDLGNDTTICIGDTLLLNAGSGYASYLWSNNSTMQSLKVWQKGTYNVLVISDKGCETLEEIAVDTVTCLNSLDAPDAFGIRMYPNPVDQNLYVLSGKLRMDANIKIIDGSGRLWKEAVLFPGVLPLEINISELPSGVYFLEIRSDEVHTFGRILKK